MDYTSSNIFSAAESAKRIAPDVAAQAASKAASRLTQSPLVAQLTVRAIEIRNGVLPRTHGSALFTRGETQALVVATPVSYTHLRAHET
ncbi:MAG: hypothetical protein EBX54_05180, partial [Betaproteobacteria bacterium]|nr:hypothetical protein [Betaproteobacteria bacterium]